MADISGDSELEISVNDQPLSTSPSRSTFPVLQILCQKSKDSKPFLILQSLCPLEGENAELLGSLLTTLPAAIADAAASVGISIVGSVPKAKKPLNSFMVFSNHMRQKLQAENRNLSNAEISKMLGARWKALSEEEKKPFVAKAAAIKRERTGPDACPRVKKLKESHAADTTERHTNCLLHNIAHEPISAPIPLPSIPIASIPVTSATVGKSTEEATAQRAHHIEHYHQSSTSDDAWLGADEESLLLAQHTGCYESFCFEDLLALPDIV